MDAQSEQRSRLRRAKILSNCEARMNRIIGNQSAPAPKCDIYSFLPDQIHLNNEQIVPKMVRYIYFI